MASQECPPNGWGSDDAGEGPSQPHPYNPQISDRGQIYCASCNPFIFEPWLCADSNHLFPGFNANWRDPQLETLQAQNTASPLATQSTMFSDATNSGSSYYPNDLPYVAGYHELGLATGLSTSTDWTGSLQNTNAGCGDGTGFSVEQYDVPEVSRAFLDVGAHVVPERPPDLEPLQPDLSSSQVDTLERFRQRWATQGHFPTDAEIQSIATLEQLGPDVVQAWFQAYLHASVTSSTSATTGSSKGKQKLPPTQDPSKPSQTVAEVRQWSRNKFWQVCKRAQTQNSRTDLQFQCTSGCSYSTDKIDAWRRHELGWQPQEFWHCVCCRSIGATPFICARKDKFLDHLRAAHEHINKALYTTLRNHSEVTDAAGFELQCKFVDTLGRPCPSTFGSWEDRVHHYLAHFRGQISYGPWNLLYGRNKWFDDDDADGQGGPNGFKQNGSLNAPDSSPTSSDESGFGTRSGGQNEQQHGQRGHAATLAAGKQTWPLEAVSAAPEPLKCRECSTQQRTRPTLLIHVPTARLSKPPLNARYLALDHTWAAKSPKSRTLASATFNATTDLLLTDERLPIPLEQLRAFAHGIGYAYLWIAELCEPQSRSCVLRSIQERASLHMVSVRCPERPQSLLHFACDSAHVKEVHAWAHHHGTISHVRNLGHGSYGIVDEVKVNPGQQVLARKELSTSRLKNRQGNAKLQEVLIMQRLNHRHISHSKSAYYDHTMQSWNILMSPVADGTLREYMAEPSRWPDRRRYIAKWYLCLAAALEYMHSASCRHKDIKPANILVSGQDVLLTDFGTSHDYIDSPVESWTEGHALMTPRYAAPEVVLEQRRGTKADVFSLGCVYAEMLTTELGHTVESMHQSCGMSGRATYAQHIEQLRQWLDILSSKTTASLHQRIITVCRSMISPDAGNRPSAKGVLDSISARSTTASHDQCLCLSSRTPDTSLPRSCLETRMPSAAQHELLAKSQRLRSGRGRRCRSRVVRTVPQVTNPDKVYAHQQLWFHRPVPAYRPHKSTSAISAFMMCSFILNGGFLSMYLETQITHSSIVISIVFSQGMLALDFIGTSDPKIYTNHDHRRFKKLYWKVLCIVCYEDTR
ncbi:hypothetical protein LTR78_000261 [Recurvomyces mirabilis]|uniref:non-specific serine/threonine protein kinase n=1 Tax=Recurvomyces mirabilis TaxID=574656 RepID=A0AAE0WY65_9PEZI|nr:hypothetical protein LTR78_000261 [Recurvomyces mirabilis]KAK5161917.1 hypothetical protein LTS14_000262 [Recurvomyces mirabilis]